MSPNQVSMSIVNHRRSSPFCLLPAIFIIISNLSVNGDLDAFIATSSNKSAFRETVFAMHAALGIRVVGTPLALGLRAEVIESVCMGRMCRDVCGIVSRASTGDDVSGTRRGSAGTRGESEGTAMFKSSTDGEDNAERHRSGEDRGHRGNDGPDWVLDSSRGDGEPEEHVGHVDNPDGLYERVS